MLSLIQIIVRLQEQHQATESNENYNVNMYPSTNNLFFSE